METVREHIINNYVTFKIQSQGYGDQIKLTLFNTLSDRSLLPISVLMYIYCSHYMISGYQKNVKLISNELIGTMMDLDIEKKYIYIQILDGASVFKKDKNIMKVH